jgi:hypothetical protein
MSLLGIPSNADLVVGLIHLAIAPWSDAGFFRDLAISDCEDLRCFPRLEGSLLQPYGVVASELVHCLEDYHVVDIS